MAICTVVREPKPVFLQISHTANAIEDSFWSWVCDGLATSDKKRAIFAQIISMMMTELSVLQYL
ncbi:hypothetical protein I79_000877 [Cricetulus griseus]|uniref:Uncharacterized protein n=1 Tax=Cricetulus griseus TaxID=10029 RepID=G3GTA1_CRIGR|nr:hypothetical protein I79_000877 [Cricetulus griseus]